jgi:hypothetical protein
MIVAATDGSPSTDVRRRTDREALPLPNALAQSAAARQQLVYRARPPQNKPAAKQDGEWRDQGFGRLCRVVAL